MDTTIDLVMWCKNGGYCLNSVLKQIEKVIPSKVVHKKILVDDYSTDNTREIAKRHDWKVVYNNGKGVGDGANTALNHVDCEFFVSFEHDLVLANDWFEKIPPQIINNKGVGAAQGVRLPDHKLLRKLQEFKIEREQRVGRTTHSMDNTIYRTDVIRDVGGFPKLPGAGVDSILVHKVLKSGYRWITDFNVISIHLRKGIKEEIRHYYGYGLASPKVSLHDPSINLHRIILTFGFSPFQGFHIALTKHDWRLAFLYPVIRFATFWGYIKGIKSVY
ncbi:MAG: glycosyltransferase [Promethearchaeota archaeon]